MSNKEVCILTNMVMVYQQNQVLVQNRTKASWPGIAFPGGHVEAGESFVKSAIREVKEETGLDVFNLEFCGIKQFQKPDDYRYIVFYFKTDCFSGTIKNSDEGEVFWIEKSQLKSAVLADGFEDMLKVFESDAYMENYYYKDEAGWKHQIF